MGSCFQKIIGAGCGQEPSLKNWNHIGYIRFVFRLVHIKRSRINHLSWHIQWCLWRALMWMAVWHYKSVECNRVYKSLKFLQGDCGWQKQGRGEPEEQILSRELWLPESSIKLSRCFRAFFATCWLAISPSFGEATDELCLKAWKGYENSTERWALVML